MPRTLRIRSSGDKQKFLQERLKPRPLLTLDGKFRAAKRARVQDFQGNNTLPVDWIVGPLTWISLADLGVEIAPSVYGGLGPAGGGAMAASAPSRRPPSARRPRRSRPSCHRACACGQHTNGESECEQCKKKGQLQRKLAVGAGNDPLEYEADRIADRVLAAPPPATSESCAAKHSTFRWRPGKWVAGSAPASVRPRPSPVLGGRWTRRYSRIWSSVSATIFSGAGAFWRSRRAMGRDVNA